MDSTDTYLRMMFGQHARKAAFNYIVQGSGGNRAAIIGNTSHAEAMAFGGDFDRSHVLVLCDVVIRPHLVIESKHLTGTGAAGLLTNGALASPEEWLTNGRVLLNNMQCRGDFDSRFDGE